MKPIPAVSALRILGVSGLLLLGIPSAGPADPACPSCRPGPGGIFPEAAPRLPSAPGLQASPVRYGLLWLEIDPVDAQISLDGEYLDKGVWLISMPPGLHYVVVGKEGFLTWTRRIGIGPGESLRISVQLEQEPRK